jgi:hypothetical protein
LIGGKTLKLMTDWTFHPTLVAPFHLHFMNGNLVTLSTVDERRAILREFQARAREVSDSQLGEMLASSWRPSLMAAWYIAYLERVHFLPTIAQMLVTRPAHALPLLVCLSRLDGGASQDAVLTYLEGCATGELQVDGYDESITPDDAVCALEYMDPDVGSAQGQVLWNKFLDWQKQSMMTMRYFGRPCTEQDILPYINGWNTRLARARGIFPQLMDLFSNELAGP